MCCPLCHRRIYIHIRMYIHGVFCPSQTYKVIFECPERKGLKVFWLIIIIITSYSLKKKKPPVKWMGLNSNKISKGSGKTIWER